MNSMGGGGGRHGENFKDLVSIKSSWRTAYLLRREVFQPTDQS